MTPSEYQEIIEVMDRMSSDFQTFAKLLEKIVTND